MTEYTVKRIALVLAIQAEIEGMKAANSQYPEDQPYSSDEFQSKAEELETLAHKHDHEL